MNLFRRKEFVCTVCKKTTGHKHKPKNGWQVEGPLCGDCYVIQMKKFYEQGQRQACVDCSIENDVPDMWEPRYQWNMNGLLCKRCFDKRDDDYQRWREYCKICEKKLGMIRYNPKRNWKIDGQLCRECWDSHKAKLG